MVLQDVLTELEELARARQYDAALEVCNRSLASQPSPSDQVRLLLWVARLIVTRDGQWNGPAISHLKTAQRLARSPELKARVLAAFTAAYAAVGSVSQCREYRRAFLEVRRKAKSPAIEAFYPMVEFNFGLANHQAELLGAAEEAYHLALSAYVGLGNPDLEQFIAGVKLNLVDVYQETEQHEDAFRLLLQVEPVLSDAAVGAIIRLRRAIYAIYRGDLAAALLQVESGLGHGSCDVRTRAHLLLTKAKILQARGHLDEAHMIAFEAMQVAAQARCNYLCHRVSTFLNTVVRGESR